jgi:hypothetical protein
MNFKLFPLLTQIQNARWDGIKHPIAGERGEK